MTRRAEQKRRTHARVLESARQCFRDEGYDGTTIAKVAARAEVASGTVIAHFPDKPSLAAASFHAEIDQAMDEGFRTLAPGPPLDGLVHLSLCLYRWYASQPELTSALLQHTLFLDGPSGADSHAQLMRFLERVGVLLAPCVPPQHQERLPILCQAYFVDYFGVLVAGLRESRQTGVFDLNDAETRLRGLLELRWASLGSVRTALGES